jgi:L-threonylcarbamoyladenylate synthase
LKFGEIEQKLIDNFWPGPLTIIFDKNSRIPKTVTAGLDTVAIRMPENDIAKKLIEYSGVPIAAPSANVSGRPSGTMVADIKEELDGKVTHIIDGGVVDIGLESTVVKVEKESVHILRPGKVTKEEIEKLRLMVEVQTQVLGKCEKDETVMSPGMKYKHYAPKAKCVLVYSEEQEKLEGEIKKLIEKHDKKVLVLAKNYNLDKYAVENKIGLGNTLEEIAKNIFTILRKVDSYNVELVIIEGVNPIGLGLAIMNRLIRACENNYIKV